MNTMEKGMKGRTRRRIELGNENKGRKGRRRRRKEHEEERI